jgi:hypothetical protein
MTRCPCWFRTSTVTDRATPFGNKSRPIAAAHGCFMFGRVNAGEL